MQEQGYGGYYEFYDHDYSSNIAGFEAMALNAQRLLILGLIVLAVTLAVSLWHTVSLFKEKWCEEKTVILNCAGGGATSPQYTQLVGFVIVFPENTP